VGPDGVGQFAGGGLAPPRAALWAELLRLKSPPPLPYACIPWPIAAPALTEFQAGRTILQLCSDAADPTSRDNAGTSVNRFDTRQRQH
jgi:hypothetical protein